MKRFLLSLFLLFITSTCLAEWPIFPILVNDWPTPPTQVKASKICAYFFTLGQNCPACVEMEPVIEELQNEGWKINVLDANEYRESYDQYQIEGTPTILILEEDQEGGTVLAKIIGIKTKEFIKNIFRKFQVKQNHKAVLETKVDTNSSSCTTCGGRFFFRNR